MFINLFINLYKLNLKMKTLFIILIYFILLNNKSYSQSNLNIELDIGGNYFIEQKTNPEYRIGNETGTYRMKESNYFFTELICSYNLNNYFSLGVGIEYNKIESDFNIISPMFNVKILYPTKLIKPFLNFGLGIGLNTNSKYTSGIQYNIGIGLSFILDKKFDFILNTNYKDIENKSKLYDETYNFKFLNYSLGLNFKIP